MKKLLILFCGITLLSISCTNKKTYRQLHEEHLASNIEYCMQPFLDKGVDSVNARNVSHCIINTIFEIDSSYITKDRAYLDKLIDQNEDKLSKCKEMVMELYKQ